VDFRVELDAFRGPVDLLLFLVRKHEVDIFDIPIARITEQYSQYIEVLQEIDINAVGDFLEMASMLVEIKSKLALPAVDESEDGSPMIDPREELVERLLEYKQYKDAASMLDEKGRVWQQRFARITNDLPTRKTDVSEQRIRDVELWDLVSAFGRILKANQPAAQSNIIYDDTPIHTYMSQIHQRIRDRGKTRFSEMFEAGMHKSAMIGVFLAVLELIRHHRVHAEQDESQSDISISAGDDFSEEIDLSNIENYGKQEDQQQP
jgi:segregation and condensation protein A